MVLDSPRSLVATCVDWWSWVQIKRNSSFLGLTVKLTVMMQLLVVKANDDNGLAAQEMIEWE